MEFIEHSLELLPEGGEAMFLLNVNALAGKARYERFYKRGVLKEILCFYNEFNALKRRFFLAEWISCELCLVCV